MKDCCIVTCAFREPYVTHHYKQLARIREFTSIPVISFVDELPYSEGIVRENIVSRFQKSLYGFKPHAIQKAIDKGYKKIVWFDPSVMPVDNPETLFEQLETMLVIIGDNEITKMTNINVIKWFGLTPDQLQGTKHLGGTVYAFNIENEKTRQVFDLWKLAEESGMFGDQNDFHEGHWADEACMSLALFKIGVKQVSPQFNYKNQKDS